MKNNEVFIDTLNRALPAVSPEVFPLKIETELPKILEENVGNFCPSCEKTIYSNLLEIDGKVYLEKNCCNKELLHLENDSAFFKKHKDNTEITPPVPDAKNYQEAIHKKPNYGISGVFLPITTKCNMNCPICYMKFNGYRDQENMELSAEEVKQKIAKYNSQEIYLYGGEPTLKENLLEIIKVVKESGNVPGITTNGLKLENKNYLKKLKKAGLKFITLQFDGFDRSANIRLRGQDYLERKLKALENIKEVGGLSVHLIAVIERGRNESEMSKIIQFALEKEFIDKINFIALLPPGNEKKTTTCSDLIKVIEKEGYFDRKYFLELVKMHRNIYEITRKIFEGSWLENWLFKKLPGHFDVVPFEKGTNPAQLLFKKREVEEINGILNQAINKETKTASLVNLLKNLGKIVKSPLRRTLRGRLSFSNKAPSTYKALEVGFLEHKDIKNTLLRTTRGGLFLVGPLASWN